GTASDSQTAYVLPVAGSTGTSYLYLGDRWAGAWGGRVNDSQYVWLALRFPSSTSMSMAWSPQLTIDTAAGAVQPGTGGSTTLVARHSGKCLDVTSASTGNGAAVKQFTCNGGANQRWQAVDAGGGFVRLLAGHSGKCLDVTDGSTSDGAALEQFSCNAGTNQQFQPQDAGGGFVRLVARQSGKCVDVTSASTSDGATVKQFSCNAGTNQQFARQG
ncbi:MAG: hypothetical protein V7637_4299, partial [Mycobacteriales bacterium]